MANNLPFFSYDTDSFSLAIHSNNLKNKGKLLLDFLKLVSGSQITLRQQEKIIFLMHFCFSRESKKQLLSAYVYIFLIYLKVMDKPLFNQIKNKKLSLDELRKNCIDKIVDSNEKTVKFNDNIVVSLEAEITFLYDQYFGKSLNFDNISFIECAADINEQEFFQSVLNQLLQWPKGPSIREYLNETDLLE